jgi:hypothetical protein
MGSLYQPGGLVFATESGSLINPSNLRNRSFKPLLKRAGLPDICFHDLRHTCATLLLSQGTHPKLVQELLGHATIAMTLDTYSHFFEHGRSDRKSDGSRAILRKNSRCCTVAAQRPRRESGVFFCSLSSTCKLKHFYEWACLDSNQGPLPYQRSALTG